MQATSVVRWGGRHVDRHSLSSASHQHSVRVDQEGLAISIVWFQHSPSLVVEAPADPLSAIPGKIFAPAETNPIKFEALDFKLGSCDLQLRARPHVVTVSVITALIKTVMCV